MTRESFTEESGAFPESNTLFWLAPAGLRPPDWRWRLARLSLKNKLPCRPQLKDAWVRRCAKFMRADRVRSTSCRPRRGLSSDHILSEAARIRFASDPLIAAELEAWVLAASRPEFIAERCGLSVEVVAAYEAVFFDVRPYLDATGYIFHRVIGRPITHGFSLSDLGSIWKFFGYMRGRHTLEVLLYTFPGHKTRSWPASFEASPDEKARLIEACRGAVFARCLPRVLSSVRDLKLILELVAGLEARREERFRPLGVAVPLLSSEDMSLVVDLAERDELVPSPTQSSTVTDLAPVKQTA
jgi:hypothetical protein